MNLPKQRPRKTLAPYNSSIKIDVSSDDCSVAARKAVPTRYVKATYSRITQKIFKVKMTKAEASRRHNLCRRELSQADDRGHAMLRQREATPRFLRLHDG